MKNKFWNTEIQFWIKFSCYFPRQSTYQWFFEASKITLKIFWNCNFSALRPTRRSSSLPARLHVSHRRPCPPPPTHLGARSARRAPPYHCSDASYHLITCPIDSRTDKPTATCQWFPALLHNPWFRVQRIFREIQTAVSFFKTFNFIPKS